MTRCTTAAHLRLWLQRQQVPHWAENELVHRLSIEQPSAIDACVNSNASGTDSAFLEGMEWGNRKNEVDATLREIRERVGESRVGMADALRSMLSDDATRQDGDLQKWLSRLRRPDPDDLPHLWTCYACFQVFERRPRRRCPECGLVHPGVQHHLREKAEQAATNHQEPKP